MISGSPAACKQFYIPCFCSSQGAWTLFWGSQAASRQFLGCPTPREQLSKPFWEDPLPFPSRFLGVPHCSRVALPSFWGHPPTFEQLHPVWTPPPLVSDFPSHFGVLHPHFACVPPLCCKQLRFHFRISSAPSPPFWRPPCVTSGFPSNLGCPPVPQHLGVTLGVHPDIFCGAKSPFAATSPAAPAPSAPSAAGSPSPRSPAPPAPSPPAPPKTLAGLAPVPGEGKGGVC